MPIFKMLDLFDADGSRMNFGVGTPSRIIDLLDAGIFLVYADVGDDNADQSRRSVSLKA